VSTTTTPKNWSPTAKVSVGMLAASLTTLVLSLSKQMGHEVPGADAAAVTTLITFAIQYLVPERK